MRFQRATLSFGLSILLVSCATTTTNYYTQTVQGWRGGNVNTLIKRWGAPDGVTKGPNGSSVIVYRTETYHAYNAPTSPAVGVSFTPGGTPVMTAKPNTNIWDSNTMSLNCTALFVVDAKGTITDTKMIGNGCYGSEAFANKKGNPDQH